jgi:hypothetical protein
MGEHMTTPVEPPVLDAPVDVEPPAKPAEPAEAKTDTTDWKAEARKHEARAKENAGAAKRLAEIEEANKTESQRLADRADAAEKRAADLEMRALRSQVALDNNLPANLVDRLRGDTAEALAEDAQSLLTLLRRSVPDVDQGVKTGGNGVPAQLVASDLKGMSPEQIVKARAEGRCNDLLGIKS